MTAAIFGCLILGTLHFDAERYVLGWLFMVGAVVAVVLEAT